MYEDKPEVHERSFMYLLFWRGTIGFWITGAIGAGLNPPSMHGGFSWAFWLVVYVGLVALWCAVWLLVQLDRWLTRPRVVIHRTVVESPFTQPAPLESPSRNGTAERARQKYEDDMRMIDALPILEAAKIRMRAAALQELHQAVASLIHR